MSTFKIHPAIGIARLGNSDDFYLAPEQLGTLPVECDDEGKEIRENGEPKRVENFKDADDLSKIKRQAARFRVFHYASDQDQQGEEIKIGGQYEFILQFATTALKKVKGTVTDIQWTVHLANKKSSWYEFAETDGMHGYGPDHPLRNPTVTQPDKRRQLITDPGPQTVSLEAPKAFFAKGENPGYPQTFPPDSIKPQPIDSLGEVMVNQQDDHQRLIVLGGRGHSGSTETPVITSFVNNDGWFDDVSDGPVTATIVFDYEEVSYDGDKKKTTTLSSSMDVPVPAWVVVAYPRYVPQMADMITLDEAMYDVFVREMAYDPQVYGVAPYDRASNNPKTPEELRIWRTNASYNPNYYPKFYAEIAGMLKRPNDFRFTFDFDFFGGGDPHNTGTGGNLDMSALAVPPQRGEDPNAQLRQFVFSIMRQSSETNLYIREPNATANANLSHRSANNKPRLMPMLCGNNPLSNVAPDKFLAMTPTQLFFLRQWADGKFVNECAEWGEGDADCKTPWTRPPQSGTDIDRGVLSNALGGAFCPGGELSWIMMNPAIYSEPYRIHHATYLAGQLSLPKPIADKDGSPAADIAQGLEPGDLTKYIGIPWQADFHECTYQNINVTYENWNDIDLSSTGDPAQESIAYNIPWWPAHRPIVVTQSIAGGQVYWASGISPNNAGDLQMVEAWKDLGFIKQGTLQQSPDNPFGSTEGFYQVERNDAALGPPVPPGKRELGQTNGQTKNNQGARESKQHSRR